MSRYCYPCIVELASSSGKPCLGEGDGYGICEACKAPNRRLYRQRTLEAFGPSAAATPMPTLRKRERYSSAPIWFGWSLVIMALGIALAALLVTRCAHGAPLTTEQWTQQAIRRLPVYYEDRPPPETDDVRANANRQKLIEAKEAQLTAIAAAVARVSKGAPLPRRQWAALLLTVGFHESTFSLRIHAGDCKPQECDRGKARSPWQLHQNAFNRVLWPRLQGIENTDVQVGEADRQLRRVLGNCVNGSKVPTVPNILTAYAGRQCFKDWPGLNERLATWGMLRP